MALTTLYKTKIDVPDFDLDQVEPHRYHRMLSRLRKKTPNGDNLTDEELIKMYVVVGGDYVPEKNVRCVCQCWQCWQYFHSHCKRCKDNSGIDAKGKQRHGRAGGQSVRDK